MIHKAIGTSVGVAFNLRIMRLLSIFALLLFCHKHHIFFAVFQCQCVKGGYTSVLNKIKHFSDFPHILLVRADWMGSSAKVKEQGLTSHKDSKLSYTEFCFTFSDCKIYFGLSSLIFNIGPFLLCACTVCKNI